MLKSERTKPTIRVKLDGGLGNQIFGYFAGRLATINSSHQLILDFRNVSRHHSKKKFDLRSFELVGELSDYPMSQFGSRTGKFFKKLTDHLKLRYPSLERASTYKWKVFKESSETKPSDLLRLEGDIQLNGYFGNFTYFDTLNSFQQDCTLRLRNESPNYRLLSMEIATKNVVALHLRRGDYKSGAAGGLGILNLQYYQNAENFLSKIIEIEELWIFSDSIDYAKKYLGPYFKEKFQIKYIGSSDLEDPAENLLLMSSAKAIITANSTFSLWAARLSEAYVVYPDKYAEKSDELFNFDYYKWHKIRSIWED